MKLCKATSPCLFLIQHNFSQYNVSDACKKKKSLKGINGIIESQVKVKWVHLPPQFHSRTALLSPQNRSHRLKEPPDSGSLVCPAGSWGCGSSGIFHSCCCCSYWRSEGRSSWGKTYILLVNFEQRDRGGTVNAMMSCLPPLAVKQSFPENGYNFGFDKYMSNNGQVKAREQFFPENSWWFFEHHCSLAWPHLKLMIY